MIPVDLYKYNDHIINFTTDEMTSKFGAFSKNKMDALYLTESMITERLKSLDEYWNEVDEP